MSLTLTCPCAASRPTAEVDGEELSWVQSSVEEVIAMLQQSPGLPSVPEVSGWSGSLCFDSVTCDCVPVTHIHSRKTFLSHTNKFSLSLRVQ